MVGPSFCICHLGVMLPNISPRDPTISFLPLLHRQAQLSLLNYSSSPSLPPVFRSVCPLGCKSHSQTTTHGDFSSIGSTWPGHHSCSCFLFCFVFNLPSPAFVPPHAIESCHQLKEKSRVTLGVLVSFPFIFPFLSHSYLFSLIPLKSILASYFFFFLHFSQPLQLVWVCFIYLTNVYWALSACPALIQYHFFLSPWNLLWAIVWGVMLTCSPDCIDASPWTSSVLPFASSVGPPLLGWTHQVWIIWLVFQHPSPWPCCFIFHTQHFSWLAPNTPRSGDSIPSCLCSSCLVCLIPNCLIASTLSQMLTLLWNLPWFPQADLRAHSSMSSLGPNNNVHFLIAKPVSSLDLWLVKGKDHICFFSYFLWPA